jgi:hypothetical protein
MSNIVVIPPTDFDNYEWEVKAKGFFSEAGLLVSGRRYRLNFYDPVRLSQEVESELQRGGVFFETNLVVINSVTRFDMERAAETLIRSGQEGFLIAEQ